MRSLHLPLKREYFNAVRDGSKKVEYRVWDDYWRKRIEGKSFDRIVLTLGYPKKDDMNRRLVRCWKGYSVITIIHPQFGSEPVKVFSINLRG